MNKKEFKRLMKLAVAGHDELRDFEGCLNKYAQDHLTLDLPDITTALDDMIDIACGGKPNVTDRVCNYVYGGDREGGLEGLWKHLQESKQ